MSKALKQIFEEVKPVKVSKVYAELCSHFPLAPVQSDAQMRQANRMIDRLMDYLNNDPSAAEAIEVSKYLTVLSDLVGAFDAKRFKFEKSEPREILAYLMEAHQLNQSDLGEEIGSQSVVSDILSGKRSLNVGHIKRLAERFKVSPALFVA
jgi:HTH-type transcriptional regulator / antitoxin HigA